jgi:hypothetical protein
MSKTLDTVSSINLEANLSPSDEFVSGSSGWTSILIYGLVLLIVGGVVIYSIKTLYFNKPIQLNEQQKAELYYFNQSSGPNKLPYEDQLSPILIADDTALTPSQKNKPVAFEDNIY